MLIGPKEAARHLYMSRAQFYKSLPALKRLGLKMVPVPGCKARRAVIEETIRDVIRHLEAREDAKQARIDAYRKRVQARIEGRAVCDLQTGN